MHRTCSQFGIINNRGPLGRLVSPRTVPGCATAIWAHRCHTHRDHGSKKSVCGPGPATALKPIKDLCGSHSYALIIDKLVVEAPAQRGQLSVQHSQPTARLSLYGSQLQNSIRGPAHVSCAHTCCMPRERWMGKLAESARR